MLFFKKAKLERQLMDEIKTYAGVKEFPLDDAKVISNYISAYNKGNTFIGMYMFSSLSVIEKYPKLFQNWDALMIKYKKLGLFPNWKVMLDE